MVHFTTIQKVPKNMIQIVSCCENSTSVLGNKIIAGNHYYVDLSSIIGNPYGSWFGNVYEDGTKENFIGNFELHKFRTIM